MSGVGVYGRERVLFDRKRVESTESVMSNQGAWKLGKVPVNKRMADFFTLPFNQKREKGKKTVLVFGLFPSLSYHKRLVGMFRMKHFLFLLPEFHVDTHLYIQEYLATPISLFRIFTCY